MPKKRKVKCPYCGKDASLVHASVMYRNKSQRWLWYCGCVPGGAIVGCHDVSTVPLGTLANQELRQLRILVHRHLDTLWQSNKLTRNDTYRILAKKLKLKHKNCHIAMFNIDQCNNAIHVISELKKTYGINQII
jgi:hypothetical protein